MTLRSWRDSLDEADQRTADSRTLLTASEYVSAALVAAGVRGEPRICDSGGNRLHATWYFERGDRSVHLTLQVAGRRLVLTWAADAYEFAKGFTPVTIDFALPTEVLAALASVNPMPSPLVEAP